ncbi:MAG: AAA family ATPase [Pseudomonadota bacterium]
MSKLKKIITIASGKGGVGKTCLSLNLAASIARRGLDVVVIDMDLGLANVDIQLGLAPTRKNISAVIRDDMDIATAVRQFKEGSFSVVAGQGGGGKFMSNLSEPALRTLHKKIRKLSESYDVTIIDCAAGVGLGVVVMTENIDQILVVTTPEPTSMMDAYALIKSTYDQSGGRDFTILMNMVPPGEDGKVPYETLAKVCEKFLSQRPKYGGWVNNYPQVRNAIRTQSLITVSDPGNAASKQFMGIADTIIKFLKNEKTKPSDKASTKKTDPEKSNNKKK